MNLLLALLSLLLLDSSVKYVCLAEDAPDYESLDGVFGSGGSGADLRPTTSSASPPSSPPPTSISERTFNLIENCTVPDMGASNTIESFRMALDQGVCHSRCLDRLTLSLEDEQSFTGYPVWPLAYTSFFFSEDGRHGKNCLRRDNPDLCTQPRECQKNFDTLQDCKRGCEIRMRGVDSGCVGTCIDCEARCFDPFFFEVTRSCEVPDFPRPCLARCRRPDCETGCNEGARTSTFFEELNPLNGNIAPHPAQPPAVTHIDDTLYRVDVSSLLPVVSSLLTRLGPSLIGYCTIVVKVTQEDGRENFFVLDDTYEVDLHDFACQTVNISYAIATANSGVSNFSPPLIFGVDGRTDMMFPDQLTNDSVSITSIPDTRVGFIQRHIIQVTWDPPTNSDLVDGYRVSLSSSPCCGNVEVDLEADTTAYTFQANSPTENLDVPPISACSYTLEIVVLPRSVVGEQPFSAPTSTEPYPIPSPSDISLDCPTAYNIESDSYNVTLRLELNSTAFIPAVIDGIDFLRFDRIQVNQNGFPIPGRGFINVTFNASAGVTLIRDLLLSRGEAREYYEYQVAVAWRQNLVVSVSNILRVVCQTSTLVFGQAPPVDFNDIIITSLDIMAVQPGEHRVTVGYQFTYDDTLYPNTTFEVWLDETEALGTVTAGVATIGPKERSGVATNIVMTTEDTFSVYFQIRTRTKQLNFVSAWSEPLVKNITSNFTRPEQVQDSQYDITGFTYSISSDLMGELEVVVDIEVTHRIREDSLTATIFLCVSTQPLSIGFSTCPVDDVHALEVVRGDLNEARRTVSHSVTLPRLGELLFVQVQSRSQANLVGEWSAPEVIRIVDIPPPSTVVTDLQLSQLVLNNGVQAFRIVMDVSWEASTPPPADRMTKRQAPVREPDTEVTKYTIAIGFEPIEDPYGAIPSTSIQRDVMVGDGSQTQITDVIDLQDPENVTLYVQMRSTADATVGSWSEPSTVLLMDTPVQTEASDNSQAIAIGISVPIAVVAAIVLFLIVALLIFFCYKQHKLRHNLKSGEEGMFHLWSDNSPVVPYIAPGMVQGKEVVVDDWEISTTDVIVEDHLGEGAFGLVFKGTVRGPLRNAKLSAKVRQAIVLPVAIKLLKDTASNKEKSDFWTEIDMMKKISEGFCANVVNMVGCVTLQEPLCLITEFVPFGDLLDYLRNQRKKTASRKREERSLRIQLEEQRKAYESMKRQMTLLQSAQSTSPGEGRLLASGSGYADFSDINSPTNDVAPAVTSETGSSSNNTSPTAQKPLLPYMDMASAGSVREEMEVISNIPAPYLEANGQYSHLEAAQSKETEEEEQDIYHELGDLDGNDLMQFAYQIATGMEYLASINIVHRDLACRNILVGEGKNLKITDFGLSREVEDVYVKTTKGRLPLKWMALESIEAREFTTSSDVWAYGVVLWEIGTMGGFPYPTIQNQDLLMMLKQGYRLEKPDNCAAEVYEIMLECWQEHPRDRPGFSQLRKKFSDLLLATTGDTYMVLEVDEQKVYYTMADEEEKVRKESVSSTDSDCSTKKEKKPKKIEKPRWAQNNAYVTTPSTFKDDHMHIDDEHYRVRVEMQEEDEEKIPDEMSPRADAATTDAEQQAQNAHAPLVGSVQQSAAFLEDQAGIPLSFISGEKPTQTPQQLPLQPKKTNAYVEDPFTQTPLADEGELMENGKVGPLSLERVPEGESVTVL